MAKFPSAKTLRGHFLIYPRFQLTLIAANTIVMAVILGFVGVQTSRSFQELRDMGASAGLNPDHAYFKFLQFQAGNLGWYLVFAFLGGIVLSTVLSLLLSHRLAGPIDRLRGYFGSIARDPRAPIRPLKFRDGDFFSELPPVINRALEHIKAEKADQPQPKPRKAS